MILLYDIIIIILSYIIIFIYVLNKNNIIQII